MLTLDTLVNIETMLLSERLTIKGSEAMAFFKTLAEVQTEKNRLINQARVTPAPVQPKTE